MPSGSYTKIFSGKWPNCENSYCFTNHETADKAARACWQWDAFTYSASSKDGCCKNMGASNCAANQAWGTGGHSFYISSTSSCSYTEAFSGYFPHCENIDCYTKLELNADDFLDIAGLGWTGLASSATPLNKMKAACSNDANCIGFTFTHNVNAFNQFAIAGCLKRDQNCAANDFGTGDYDYYSKCGSIASYGDVQPVFAPEVEDYGPPASHDAGVWIIIAVCLVMLINVICCFYNVKKCKERRQCCMRSKNYSAVKVEVEDIEEFM